MILLLLMKNKSRKTIVTIKCERSANSKTRIPSIEFLVCVWWKMKCVVDCHLLENRMSITADVYRLEHDAYVKYNVEIGHFG